MSRYRAARLIHRSAPPRVLRCRRCGRLAGDGAGDVVCGDFSSGRPKYWAEHQGCTPGSRPPGRVRDVPDFLDWAV